MTPVYIIIIVRYLTIACKMLIYEFTSGISEQRMLFQNLLTVAKVVEFQNVIRSEAVICFKI